jgi:hypothetical protein
MKATIRIAAVQTGTLDATARRIVAFWKDSGGSYQSSFSSAAPNAVGSYDLSHTFTIPVGATEAFIRLMNGASVGNGEVYWDKTMLVEGAYTGPYFDGDTGELYYANQQTLSEWEGVAHDSTSIIEYYNLLTTPGSLGDAYVIDNVLWVYTDNNRWESGALLPTP